MNYFRKVSKYDLDRKTVDWRQYQKERQRQITRNVECRKENEELLRENFLKENFDSKEHRI